MLHEGFLVTVLPPAMVKAGDAIFGLFFLLQGMRKRRHFCVVVYLFPVPFRVSSITLHMFFPVDVCKLQPF